MRELSRARSDGEAGTILARWGAGWFLVMVVAIAAAIATLVAVSATLADAQSSEPSYQKKESPLTTPWTNEVGPDNALPEYPRPQMTRDRWQNLNGVWQFSARQEGDAPPIGQELGERILVPYPVESALSGIKRHEDRMFYRRTFNVPKDWRRGKERVLMHFGAVDYLAVVYVNGTRMAAHRGGYDEFTLDVTDALKKKGPQEVVVAVTDLTNSGGQAVGKQTLNPGGIFYTPNSGIWQTVWMEPVNEAGIDRLDMTPNLDTDTLSLNVKASGVTDEVVQAIAYDGSREVGRVTGPANQPLKLAVPNPKLWSPDNPFLYDIKVNLMDKNRQVDTVGSYFGMRSVSVQKGKDGKPRMYLNGKFLANVGTLDQGYWPDGVYTAPTDEALKFDLQAHKDLGYNMVRKHIKVEPDRWFYWADKLGLMVWQDMPSMRPDLNPNPAQQQQWESEFKQIVDEHKSFTSITTWVPYNEGWGELNKETTARVAGLVKEWDPSRLVNAHSGVNCCNSEGDSGAGDIYDAHSYQDPGLRQPFDDRATVAGEYGGVALQPAPEHEYDSNLTFAPYGAEPNAEALTSRYEELQNRLRRGVQSCGVSAGVYTEITDLEGEINGMYTYDRQVFKPSSMDRIRAANQSVIDASENTGTIGGNFPPGTPGITGVSYYPFSEGSGTTTEDEGTNDADDHDGTLVGPPQWDAGHPGSPGDSGLHFDGNDSVDTGASILDTTGNYSVAAWVKLDNLNGFQTAVSQDGDRVSAFFLQYSVADNRLAFSFANTRALAPTAPEVGRWYHMVGVRDAASGQLKLYIDGQLVATKTACLGDASSGNTVIGRGKFGGDPVDYWKGDLDQVHVYDRAISDSEIAELYGSGK